MAHEIMELDGAAYAIEPAWHGLGVVLPDHMTADQALTAAQLDWPVDKEPLFDAYGNEGSDWFLTVRGDLPTDDSRRVLGVVGRSYTPVQNHELFGIAEAILGESGARFETAFSMRNGRMVAVTIRLPEIARVLGSDTETLAPYLLCYNSHDRSTSLEVMLTDVRVVCRNTLNFAVQGAANRIRLRHTGAITSEVTEARRILKLTTDHREAVHGKLHELAETPVDELFVRAYLEALFPTPAQHAAQTERIRSTVRRLYDGAQPGGDSPACQQTAYGLLNAVVDYADHERAVRVTRGRTEMEARADSVLFGSAASLKQQAFELLLKRDALLRQAHAQVGALLAN